MEVNLRNIFAPRPPVSAKASNSRHARIEMDISDRLRPFVWEELALGSKFMA